MNYLSGYRFPYAILVATALLAVVSVGLLAHDLHENAGDSGAGEGPVETPIQIQSATLQQKQDSVYAAIDEQFKLVRPIFETACFDCHSTDTAFPWYHKIPGIKQWMNGHMSDALEHVDLTDGFPFKGRGTPLEKIKVIRKEVKSGDMPLLSYRLMHWSAWLSDAEKDSIYIWVDTSVIMLEQFFKEAGIAIPDSSESEHEH